MLGLGEIFEILLKDFEYISNSRDLKETIQSRKRRTETYILKDARIG